MTDLLVALSDLLIIIKLDIYGNIDKLKKLKVCNNIKMRLYVK